MDFFNKLFSLATAPKHQVSLDWVSDLYEMDDISAIEYSTKRISDDFKKNLFQDELFLEALFSIDEKTHSIVERITTHFINIEKISVDLEVRISNVVFMYHRQLFLVYYALVENFAQIYPHLLHIFLARAMRNATQMIKWRYYNYQSAPANVWLQISHLYKIAEQKSMLNAKIQAYSDQEPISLSTAYIHACMLGTLESISLKCQQIELASRMLVAWGAKISIENVFDAEHHLFYVDTANNSPAKRIRNFKPADSYRYWCFDHINSKIELCLSLIEYKISPKQPQMKEFINNKHALTTLEALNAEWSRLDYKRQRRTEERSKNIAPVYVTYGFQDICNQFKQLERIKAQRGEQAYQGDKSLEERLAAHSVTKGETNIIHMNFNKNNAKIIDQSSKGYGLHIIKQVHEVNLGMLTSIAIREQKYSNKLGIIRNVRSLASNQLQIGIELISNLGLCVDIENISLSSRLAGNNNHFNAKSSPLHNTNFGDSINFQGGSFDDNAENFHALYLPKEPSLAMQETLIIPKLQYNKNDLFKANLLGEDVLIRFTKSFENDANWVRATFTTEITH